MMYLILIGLMGLLSRLSGNGFGERWGVSWLPEALFALVIGLTSGFAFSALGFLVGFAAVVIGTSISYLGMQSGTWMFLNWESHDDPNTERTSTLKPVVDWIASKFGYALGDEGYAWVAAALKGFLITLPVGGLGAIFWPLGYELGSHAKGRVEKWGLDPHAFSEVFAGIGAGIATILFIVLIIL